MSESMTKPNAFIQVNLQGMEFARKGGGNC